ncbi:MAG: diadenylate cyclase [Candidatus Methanolliviera hydrocarbonicum]|uniref:Diadenylate cyclase n=1 Tax=Candidatus Methanolliviera hydrocarbonicum TaxID=2491085 RepID=A0A520KWE4_9EURY|nr:MAG: diadenylate cyclase [Candidatus Methanolliviera hydrocarbonicum]
MGRMGMEEALKGIINSEGIKNTLFFIDGEEDLKFLECLKMEGKVVVGYEDLDVKHSPFLKLPFNIEDREEAINFAVWDCLEKGILNGEEKILCVFKTGSDVFNTLLFLDVSNVPKSKIYDLLKVDGADADVISYVVDLAMELGWEGIKGESVGAIFIVGDSTRVMKFSRPISYNPFDKNYVNIKDTGIRSMIKEFAELDGAFVISGKGEMIAAYRYLDVSTEGIEIPKGLGARHIAAAAITKNTRAIAIVLSETDEKVRIFKGGKILTEIG